MNYLYQIFNSIRDDRLFETSGFSEKDIEYKLYLSTTGFRHLIKNDNYMHIIRSNAGRIIKQHGGSPDAKQFYVAMHQIYQESLSSKLAQFKGVGTRDELEMFNRFHTVLRILTNDCTNKYLDKKLDRNRLMVYLRQLVFMAAAEAAFGEIDTVYTAGLVEFMVLVDILTMILDEFETGHYTCTYAWICQRMVRIGHVVAASYLDSPAVLSTYMNVKPVTGVAVACESFWEKEFTLEKGQLGLRGDEMMVMEMMVKAYMTDDIQETSIHSQGTAAQLRTMRRMWRTFKALINSGDISMKIGRRYAITGMVHEVAVQVNGMASAQKQLAVLSSKGFAQQRPGEIYPLLLLLFITTTILFVASMIYTDFVEKHMIDPTGVLSSAVLINGLMLSLYKNSRVDKWSWYDLLRATYYKDTSTGVLDDVEKPAIIRIINDEMEFFSSLLHPAQNCFALGKKTGKFSLSGEFSFSDLRAAGLIAVESETGFFVVDILAKSDKIEYYRCFEVAQNKYHIAAIPEEQVGEMTLKNPLGTVGSIRSFRAGLLLI